MHRWPGGPRLRKRRQPWNKINVSVSHGLCNIWFLFRNICCKCNLVVTLLNSTTIFSDCMKKDKKVSHLKYWYACEKKKWKDAIFYLLVWLTRLQISLFVLVRDAQVKYCFVFILRKLENKIREWVRVFGRINETVIRRKAIITR